jgi:hypothetical protein
MACSIEFRTPTGLKSTDRQLGQRAENTVQAPVFAALPVEVASALRKPWPETATLG